MIWIHFVPETHHESCQQTSQKNSNLLREIIFRNRRKKKGSNAFICEHFWLSYVEERQRRLPLYMKQGTRRKSRSSTEGNWSWRSRPRRSSKAGASPPPSANLFPLLGNHPAPLDSDLPILILSSASPGTAQYSSDRGPRLLPSLSLRALCRHLLSLWHRRTCLHPSPSLVFSAIA